MADEKIDAAVNARQSLMRLYVFNIGTLGAMAKGAIDYDAATASAAAENLRKLASINQQGFWPQGSSTAELGDKTRARPEIWSTFPAIMDKVNGLADATTALAASAGTLDGLRAGIGGVGKACGACHKEFRVKRE
ncbi:MAG: c-type cytochrome [Paracoccaceae bacterium]